jgi:lysozyme family protein
MKEANQKITLLEATSSDYEWYPTTDQILRKMNEDIYSLFRSERLNNFSRRSRHRELFSFSAEYVKGKYHHHKFFIGTFLDVGAGDGRVNDMKFLGFNTEEGQVQ